MDEERPTHNLGANVEYLSHNAPDVLNQVFSFGVISELNQTTKFEGTYVKYFPEAASLVYHSKTTEQYIKTAGIMTATSPRNSWNLVL